VWDNESPAQDGTLPSFDAVDDVENLTIAVRNVVNEDVSVPVTTTGTITSDFTDSTPNFLGNYTRTFINTFTGSQAFTVNPDTMVTGTALINVGLVPTGLFETSNS